MSAQVIEFPYARRARQIHEESLEKVDARLATILRPVQVQVVPDPDDGPRAA